MLVQSKTRRAKPGWRPDAASDTPVYQQIVDHLREAVATGHLAPRHGLPSVRAWAKALGVNPNTVARAYDCLQREGVVRGEPGRGMFVSVDRESQTQTQKRSGTILLLCDAGTLSDEEPNFAFQSFMRNLEGELAKAGMAVQLMIVGADRGADLARLAAVRAAGVVGVGDLDAAALELLGNKPLVSTGTWRPARLPWLGDDMEAISRAMTAHLLDRGHREIVLLCEAMIGPPTVGLFAAGHKRAFQEAGVPWRRSLVVPALAGESLSDVAREVLTGPAPPTAIFAENARVCRAVLDAAAELGLRIPEDLSLVSYGKNVAHLVAPIAVTTWLPDYVNAGSRVAQLVLEMIAGQSPPNQPEFIAGGIREGNSVRHVG